MNDKDIKNKIKTSFSEETPDILGRIMNSCENEDRINSELGSSVIVNKNTKKRISGLGITKYATVAASMIVVFIVGLVLGNMINLNVDKAPENVTPELANIYIDVNPSIEMQVSEEGIVVSCNAANDDAKAVLGDMQLSGVNVKTALNAIIGSMYMNGYMNAESNSMLVSMNAENGEKFKNLLSGIVSDVNEIVQTSGISCSIVAQDLTLDDETAALAKENNISVGKMSLINKIINETEDYTSDDISHLAGSAIKDLNEIYAFLNRDKFENEKGPEKDPEHGEENEDNGNDDDKDDHESDREDEREEQKDIISGVLDKLDGDKEDALELALEYLSDLLEKELSRADVDKVSVSIRRETIRDDHIPKPKYVYEISFEYEEKIYEYDVDLEKEIISERIDHAENIPVHDPEHGFEHDPEHEFDGEDTHKNSDG